MTDLEKIGCLARMLSEATDDIAYYREGYFEKTDELKNDKRVDKFAEKLKARITESIHIYEGIDDKNAETLKSVLFLIDEVKGTMK